MSLSLEPASARRRVPLPLLVLVIAGCGPATPATDHAPERSASNQNQSGGAEEPPDAGERERTPIGLEAPPDVAAAPPEAEITASGLASRVLLSGDGVAHPGPRDRVTVHYTGWLTSGERFDSSVQRGRPATFALNGVIAGWTEGVQLMVVGERRRFWIPEGLAYRGRPGAPAGTLVFDVELLAFEAVPDVPTPENVSAAPPSAARSASGLAWIVLRAGTGQTHPTETSRVRVHYSGWRAETGELFDSSVTRGRPATFPLNRVIPGWTEGVQLMVVGERRRFWIPQALAYDGRPGAPSGTLVFDVELLAIE